MPETCFAAGPALWAPTAIVAARFVPQARATSVKKEQRFAMNLTELDSNGRWNRTALRKRMISIRCPHCFERRHFGCRRRPCSIHRRSWLALRWPEVQRCCLNRRLGYSGNP
jgi:hypothetical protein